MQRPLYKRLGYGACQVLTRLFGTALFRIRVRGRENVPTTTGGLVCSNHQSYFDPVLVGLAVDRRLNYLARASLFRHPLFRWLIDFLDAIPIDRDRSGFGGLKETLRRLKRDELVLIFPEGTRTRDGDLQSLKSGFCAVARRSERPLIPVGLDGSFQAWPRSSPLPRLSTLAVVIGEPIPAELIASLSDEELVAELQRRIAECFEQARELGQTRRAATSSPRPRSPAGSSPV